MVANMLSGESKMTKVGVVRYGSDNHIVSLYAVVINCGKDTYVYNTLNDSFQNRMGLCK